MSGKEKFGPIGYSEDPSRGISIVRERKLVLGHPVLTTTETSLENGNLRRHRHFNEEKGEWSSFSLFYPLEGGVTAKLYCSRILPTEETLRVDFFSEQSEGLGGLWYDKQGKLILFAVYPLTCGLRKFNEAMREEGLDRSVPEDHARLERLAVLSSSSSLQVEPEGQNLFRIKGVQEVFDWEEKVPGVEFFEVGLRKSGEIFWWDEYRYRFQRVREGIKVEVLSPLKAGGLKKRLVFPSQIEAYDEVYSLLTEDEADWQKIPSLLPLTVEFPAGII